jgi:hypothetical protein
MSFTSKARAFIKNYKGGTAQLEKDALAWAKSNRPDLYQRYQIAKDSGVADLKFILGLVIGVYVMASVLPGAITAITGACTSGWGTAEIALWGLLPLVLIVIVLYRYYKEAE